MKNYRQRIEAAAPGHNPRWVEAYMRVACGVLDHLTPSRFDEEARLAAKLSDMCSPLENELLSSSYRL